MSEEADALAEMARNRGLRLVRSRVRTPTKRAYGKYGLADAKGTKLLGLEGKHPSATAEQVANYLRTELVSDWAGSLGVDPPKTRKPRSAPARKTPPPPPRPKLRAAVAGDAAAIVALAALLEHAIDESGVVARLKVIKVPQLVATIGAEIVGLCGLDRQVHLHRSAPVGRITILAVAKAARGQGIGRMLVEEAEKSLAKLGCEMIEVSSNNSLVDAHRFYLHLGFEQRSQRFVKTL